MNENDYYTCNHKSYSDCIAEIDTHLKAIGVRPIDTSWLYNEILPLNVELEEGQCRLFEKKLCSLKDIGSCFGWCVASIRNTGEYFELNIDIRYL